MYEILTFDIEKDEWEFCEDPEEDCVEVDVVVTEDAVKDTVNNVAVEPPVETSLNESNNASLTNTSLTSLNNAFLESDIEESDIEESELDSSVTILCDESSVPVPPPSSPESPKCSDTEKSVVAPVVSFEDFLNTRKMTQKEIDEYIYTHFCVFNDLIRSKMSLVKKSKPYIIEDSMIRPLVDSYLSSRWRTSFDDDKKMLKKLFDTIRGYNPAYSIFLTIDCREKTPEMNVEISMN